MDKTAQPSLATFPCVDCKFNINGHCEGYPCSKPIKWYVAFEGYWTAVKNGFKGSQNWGYVNISSQAYQILKDVLGVEV